MTDRNVADYIAALLAAPKLARQVTCHKVLEERPATFAECARPWPKAIRGVLHEAGIPSLYSHQARAADLIRAGRDVVVTTPTASGKTLIYNLPVLERYLQDRDARGLYLFPLKALAQDQRAAFERLTAHWPRDARPRAALYDGDTSDHFRRKVRDDPPTVLITNPEMLHLGILPHHERWTTFLASLAFVVLDEAHTYRGVPGAHMAQLLRRLDRVCLRYNARPARVLCTATVGNPEELGRNLLGERDEGGRLETITETGAPQGKRHVVFLDPEESPSTLAIRLLQSALARGLRTIVYCRSRRMTELIGMWAADKAGPYRDRISAYRAGFLPEERRDIEARMASGELLAVVSTSALELGIDIGGLDLCILVGYPGSVMATLQRGGRVGRQGQESAVLLVAGEDALDQYFIHNPDEFFQRPPEQAVLNPDNEVVLARHLECAAAEMPLRDGEIWLRRPAVRAAVADLEGRGLLLRTADGLSWLAARKRPQRDVDLRGSGASFQIEDTDGNVIGSVDAHQAFRETHPGAVYLHRGRSYVIRELDPGAKIARAVPRSVNWHTRVRTSKATEILEVYASGHAFAAPAAFGRLRVTETVGGYERRLNGSLRLLDIQPLELPPQVFETEGLWFVVPDPYREAVEDKLLHFMGSIHALEHASIGLMPLLVMADRNDLGGISIPMHAQLGAPAVFVYDGLPGGAGLTRAAFPLLEELFKAVGRTLALCPCETGCPSCTHSPKCGSGNRPLDKAGALFLISRLVRGAYDSRYTAVPEENTKGEASSPRIVSAGHSAPRPLDSVVGFRPGTETAIREAPEEYPFEPSRFAEQGGNERREAGGIDSPRPGAGRSPDSCSGPVMVFDVETRRSADEVGGWNRADRMGVSVAVVWDGKDFRAFRQEELPAMFALLRRAGLVVGFNSLRFDYRVLQPFADFDLRDLPSLDLLDVIKTRLNYRVSLDNLGRATLDAPKSADGLQALRWWKEGRLDEITAYCRADVDITRRLYEYGRDRGHLLFTNKAGQKVRVPVEW
ncbi:MAG TPA: DEAD/DEAH box helicase [Candidatus Mailhella merdigallinarum]|uniref:DEAD/DEAH box helicase n=1 Tax=Candidatus Mailhella merdigallinarum TaxID=2838658 RepID=A0A9D2HD01_9BACT|nr:DEAD/DEAH box helicase [Candidatus Mailhella merdigallinarum]